MHSRIALVAAASIVGVLVAPLLAQSKNLLIYVVDVEGGQSTLFVSPSRESVLVDTGWPGDRDAARIVAAANYAGVKQIDHLLITHFHTDHIGGVSALAAKIKDYSYGGFFKVNHIGGVSALAAKIRIRNLYDHGETVERSPARILRSCFTTDIARELDRESLTSELRTG